MIVGLADLMASALSGHGEEADGQGGAAMTEYRASFDAVVTFSNGGDLAVHGFRVDVPSPDIGPAGVAALFVASLGLLMTDAVELRNLKIFAEPHGHHHVPDQGNLAWTVRPRNRVRHRPAHHGRQHRNLPGRAPPPLC
jgi:hypothetical protein